MEKAYDRMARLDPSIRHAITPPEFGEDKLHREHLVDRLYGEIPRKLVAIAAPAGYGKTTLLADFAAHTEIPVVWVHASEQDQDLMRFASVLLAGLERRFRRLRNELDLRTYSEEGPRGLGRALANLLEEHVPESFVILVDDSHLLHRSKSVMTFLDTFLEEIPEQVTLFASGREVLDVSLARLMAEGNLAGFGPHELAFTHEELQEWSSLIGSDQRTSREIEDLLHRTQGWITGIVLSEASGSALSLESGLSEDLVYEYLASVVLNRQPDDLRRFMIDASVLPVMTAPLCDAVLERSDSDELLRTVANRGLFVTSSASEPRTYEFHPLFRSLLQETLKAQGQDRYFDLQVRAAFQLRDQDPEIAFQLLIAAQRFGDAERIVQEAAEEYLWLGRHETLRIWSESLAEYGRVVPILDYCLAVVESDRGDQQAALQMLSGMEERELEPELRAKVSILRAKQMIRIEATESLEHEIGRAIESAKGIGNHEISGRLHRLHALRESIVEADHAAAVASIEKAISEFKQIRNKDLLLASLQDKTHYLLSLGELEESRMTALEALEFTKDRDSPIASLASINNLAHIEYLEGSIDDALHHYSEARSIAKRSGFLQREGIVIFGQAEAFSDTRLTFQAASLYQEILDIGSRLDSASLLSMACIGTSTLHRRNGGYQLASEWLRRASEFNHHGTEALWGVENAILVGSSEPEKGAARLDKLIREYGSQLGPREASVGLLFSSVFKKRIGEASAAHSTFRDCLDECGMRGAIQYVAAELVDLEGDINWMGEEFTRDPVYVQIERRISILNAFRDHYVSSRVTPKDETHLEIRGLGGAMVLKGAKQIESLKPQALELLIYLVDKSSAARDELAEVFWHDHPVGRQTANLHMTIYDIRRALGKDAVEFDGTTYRINEELKVRYDVKEFEQATKVVMELPPGDPRRLFALTEAVSLYRGQFLPEFFGDWVVERRRSLELEYLDIAADHAEEALLRDQPRKALKSLRFALDLDPFRDDLNQRYLQILHRLGRRTEAITHYRKYSRMIREEFNLEPPKDVQELHDRIVSG